MKPIHVTSEHHELRAGNPFDIEPKSKIDQAVFELVEQGMEHNQEVADRRNAYCLHVNAQGILIKLPYRIGF